MELPGMQIPSARNFDVADAEILRIQNQLALDFPSVNRDDLEEHTRRGSTRQQHRESAQQITSDYIKSEYNDDIDMIRMPNQQYKHQLLMT